jgi:hypothetical protein
MVGPLTQPERLREFSRQLQVRARSAPTDLLSPRMKSFAIPGKNRDKTKKVAVNKIGRKFATENQLPE